MAVCICEEERVFPPLFACFALPIYLAQYYKTANDATILRGVNSFLFIRLLSVLVHNYTPAKQPLHLPYAPFNRTTHYSHNYDPTSQFFALYGFFRGGLFRLTALFFPIRNPSVNSTLFSTLFIEFSHTQFHIIPQSLA